MMLPNWVSFNDLYVWKKLHLLIANFSTTLLGMFLKQFIFYKYFCRCKQNVLDALFRQLFMKNFPTEHACLAVVVRKTVSVAPWLAFRQVVVVVVEVVPSVKPLRVIREVVAFWISGGRSGKVQTKKGEIIPHLYASKHLNLPRIIRGQNPTVEQTFHVKSS